MVKLISVNERGVLTLPKEARERLGVSHGGQLFMGIDEQGEVILRAGVVMPIEIYSNDRIEEFNSMNEVPLAEMNLQWKKGQ
jgi:bifunctional DNA-binding transcriptional regulator/antitoxin component of YhaV-PrlF toxin-antitoxin module